jgi:hypothetical protein
MKHKLCSCQWEYAFNIFKESTPITDHSEYCTLQVHAAQLDGLYVSASASKEYMKGRDVV